jgi:hypothetical protein
MIMCCYGSQAVALITAFNHAAKKSNMLQQLRSILITLVTHVTYCVELQQHVTTSQHAVQMIMLF